MSAECLRCAAPGCSRNEPKIGRIIWKTASFPFQLQVRGGIQHLSHFSLPGAHHSREVEVHPSPWPCRSDSSHSAVPLSREIPAESMGRLRERDQAERAAGSAPRFVVPIPRALPVIYRNISAARGSRGAAALCVCVFERFCLHLRLPALHFPALSLILFN